MTIDISALPLISAAKCETFQGYDQVLIWSRGGYCGEIKVWSGDGEKVVAKLMAPESERIVEAMHAAVVRMRRETIEEVLAILEGCAFEDHCSGCITTGENDVDCPGHLYVREPLDGLTGAILALLPPDEDQPIPYTLTDKGKEGVK